VTFDQWDECASNRGCDGYRPSDAGWGRGKRPVINVSWEEATQYAIWLSKITGKQYRLLTEAEYEYATRAGSTTTYPWGNDIKLNGEPMANCDICGSQWDSKQTAPVGSFAPNEFGLFDMLGNVLEWVEDCDNYGYVGAPQDGSAWISGGNCSDRTLRGGSWQWNSLGSAVRFTSSAVNRFDDHGFRIGRTLLPP
jgi:formylglycine-generating enzyme required for sulfatase activity